MKKIVPLKEIRIEIVVVNSRFIAALSRVTTVEAARIFIRRERERYPDASHHVPVFVIGHGNSVIAHSSDDGEPAGTAGRPALAVLQGSGLGDTVVVVTRYFGGTKLGTGGLVRAYGDAVRKVLKETTLAEIIPTDLFAIELSYPYYERLKRLLARYHAIVEDEQFTDKVSLQVRIMSTDHDTISNQIVELTSGSANIHILQQQVESLFPVENSSSD